MDNFPNIGRRRIRVDCLEMIPEQSLEGCTGVGENLLNHMQLPIF